MIKTEVVLGFNPAETKGTEDDVSGVFKDEVARTLWLTWKQGHITNQYFVGEVFEIASAIRKAHPKTVEALRKCFSVRWMNPSTNFMRTDMNGYMPEALPFFTGEKTVTYTIAECAKRPRSVDDVEESLRKKNFPD